MERSFVVAKLAQTITFGPLSRQTVGDAPFPLSASASSGLPVSFAIVSGPAVLSGNIVTLTGAGIVAVRASQVGNAMYAAANVDQTIEVLPPMNTLVAQQRFGDGSFQLAFYGESDGSYRLLVSTNLVDWESITNFVVTNSPVLLVDPAATNANQRFYRAVMP